MSSPDPDAANEIAFRDRLTRGMRSRGVGLGCFALLVVLAWPGLHDALLFPDTHEYLKWPAPVRPDPERYVGPRLPAYPLLLKGIGIGAPLVLMQTYASLAAFSHLGWTLARVPGVILMGLLSLAPALQIWNGSALTESISHTLIAFLLDAGLILGARFSLPWLIAWACALMVFATTRAPNVVAIPFLAVPLLAWLHDLRSFNPLRAGLTANPARFIAATGIALACFGTGLAFTEASHGWQINYHTAIWTRIGPNPEARAFLAKTGLPPRARTGSDEFKQWYKEHGRSAYQQWVIRQPASYTQAWLWLDRRDEAAELFATYFADREQQPGLSPIAPLAAVVHEATALPPRLWLALLLAAPLVTLYRHQRLDALTLWLPALALGTYVQCFVTFNASGIEELRHTLGASFMLRLSGLMAIVALARAMSARSTAPQG
jgi:hypothetical protein